MGEAKKRKNTLNTLQAQKQISWMSYLPLYFIVAFIPHMYGYAPHAYAPSEAAIFGQKGYIDVYLIWKARGLFVLTVLAGIMFLWNVFNGKIKLKWDYFTISVSVMTGIILISTFTSKYQDVVYIGGRERFEGMYVYLCYMAIMFIARYYGNDEKFVKNISTFLMYSVFVMSIPVFFQAFGYDMYTMSPLVWIFYPPEIASKASELISMNMTGGTVGALFNSNYSGVFMLMGVVIALWKILEVESTRKKIFYLVIASLASFGLLTSKSDASILTFGVAVAFLFLIKAKKIKEKWKIFVLYFICFYGVLILSKYLFKVSSSNTILYLAPSIVALFCYTIANFVEIKGRLVSYVVAVFIVIGVIVSPFIVTYFMPYKDVTPDDYEVLGTENNAIVIKKEGMDDVLKIYFDEEEGITTNLPEKVNIKYDTSKKRIDIIYKSYLLAYKIYSNNSDGSYIFTQLNENFGALTTFKYLDGKMYVMSPFPNQAPIYGLLDNEIEKIDFLYQKSQLYSERSGIWSKFIPLLFKEPIIGHGADTFTYIFPQGNFLTRYNEGFTSNVIVDKPHSLILDVSLSFGIIYLLLFLYLILLGISNTIYLNREEIFLAFFILLIVYISGIFNDSILGVSQIFYVYLGISNFNQGVKYE